MVFGIRKMNSGGKSRRTALIDDSYVRAHLLILSSRA